MIRSFGTLMVVLTAIVQSTLAQSEGPRLITSFGGDMPCGHMTSQLDGVLAEWSTSPENTIAVVYTSERYRKNIIRRRDGMEIQELRLVHRDDGLNWAKGIPKYLLARMDANQQDQKKISPDRISLIDAGYDEETRIDIWFVPPGSKFPAPRARLKAEDITFGRKQRQRIPDYANCYSMYY